MFHLVTLPLRVMHAQEHARCCAALLNAQPMGSRLPRSCPEPALSGDIVHQGVAYSGQHEADPELWQIVQNKLAVHRLSRRRQFPEHSAQRLAGCADHCGRRHLARPPSPGPSRDRIANHSGAYGGVRYRGVGDRRRRSRRARLAGLRAAEPGSGARRVRHHSTRDVEAHQHGFLLPCDSDDRRGSRGCLAAAAEALFCRARSRS
jgi:hypothetical protein